MLTSEDSKENEGKVDVISTALKFQGPIMRKRWSGTFLVIGVTFILFILRASAVFPPTSLWESVSISVLLCIYILPYFMIRRIIRSAERQLELEETVHGRSRGRPGVWGTLFPLTYASIGVTGFFSYLPVVAGLYFALLILFFVMLYLRYLRSFARAPVVGSVVFVWAIVSTALTALFVFLGSSPTFFVDTWFLAGIVWIAGFVVLRLSWSAKGVVLQDA